MSNIGCASGYSALIVRQPGEATNQGNTPTVLGSIDEITHLEWGRIKNAASAATLTATACPTNCSLLARTSPWAYELWLYRDTEFAWGGPILIKRDMAGTLQIQALDVTTYLKRRTIHAHYSNTNDPVDIAADLAFAYFLGVEDPQFFANLSIVSNQPDNISVEYDPNQYTVGEKWADMVTAGASYTTLGRYTFLTGQKAPNYLSPYLIDATDIIGNLELIEDATQFATRVTGLGEGITSVLGPTTPDLEYYGLIDLPPVKYQGITNQTQLDNLTQQLYNQHNQLQPQLVIPDGSALASGTEIINQGTNVSTFTKVALEDLIPGLRYDIQIGETHCAPGIYPMQLNELKVTWTPDTQETINVSFTNIGPTE